jgi:hypothetical protein
MRELLEFAGMYFKTELKPEGEAAISNQRGSNTSSRT